MGEDFHLQDVTGPYDPQTLVDHCTELIRRQPAPFVDPVRVPSPRRALQILALTAGVTLYAGAVYFLQQPTVDPAARPPAAVLALEGDETCVQRQAAIVEAIAAYRREHGHVPDSLGSLTPGYMPEPATDPGSGRPYGYTLEGSAVVVSCPDPNGHS